MQRPTIEYVLTAEGAFEFKSSVKALANALLGINDDAAARSAEVASQLFRIAYELDLDADDLKASFAPLADISDAIELAMDTILDKIANRPEAYITPPPGDATGAIITPGAITEQ